MAELLLHEIAVVEILGHDITARHNPVLTLRIGVEKADARIEHSKFTLFKNLNPWNDAFRRVPQRYQYYYLRKEEKSGRKSQGSFRIDQCNAELRQLLEEHFLQIELEGMG